MNAYELADKCGLAIDDYGFATELRNMLRQQADEIQLLRQGMKDGFDGLESMTKYSKAQADKIKELEEKIAFLEERSVIVEPQQYGFQYLYGDDMLEAQKRINNLLRKMVDDLDAKEDK